MCNGHSSPRRLNHAQSKSKPAPLKTDCEAPPPPNPQHMVIFGGVYMQHDCTVKSTPVVCLCLSYTVTSLLLLTNIILCVIMCTVSSPPPETSLKISQSGCRLCRHSRLSRGVKRRCQRCICCSHISEDTRKRLSVDFICLFGSLPDCWSVHCARGKRRLSRCTCCRQA